MTASCDAQPSCQGSWLLQLLSHSIKSSPHSRSHSSSLILVFLFPLLCFHLCIFHPSIIFLLTAQYNLSPPTLLPSPSHWCVSPSLRPDPRVSILPIKLQSSLIKGWTFFTHSCAWGICQFPAVPNSCLGICNTHAAALSVRACVRTHTNKKRQNRRCQASLLTLIPSNVAHKHTNSSSVSLPHTRTHNTGTGTFVIPLFQTCLPDIFIQHTPVPLRRGPSNKLSPFTLLNYVMFIDARIIWFHTNSIKDYALCHRAALPGDWGWGCSNRVIMDSRHALQWRRAHAGARERTTCSPRTELSS